MSERNRKAGTQTAKALTRQDPNFYRRLGRAGGRATLAKHGRGHFAQMGRKGGAETLARRGADFMAEISQIAVEMRQSKR